PSLLLTVLPATTLSSLGPTPHPDSPAAAAGTDTRYSATRYSDPDGRRSKNSDIGKGFTGNGGAGGQGFELPNLPSRFDASAAWRQMQQRTADSCWSQQERHLYHTANPSPPSAAFRAAVEEFEAMQRERVGLRGVDSWQWVKDKATWNETIPRYGRERKQCRYIAIQEINRGVGNRITSYVISFVLGLLTHRAIIAPPSAFLTRRFCNPFAHANASWTVGPITERLLLSTVLQQPKLHMSVLTRQLYWRGNGASGNMRRRVQEDGTIWLDLSHRVRSEFCGLLWGIMGAARFWFTNIDAYFLPSLYYVPPFAARLNELFPDGRVFTHVARYLLHPDNQLWDEITAVFHAKLAHFPHRLGIQIRSPDAIDLPVAHRVLDCAINISHYLPPTAPRAPDAPWAPSSESPYEKMGVFVSSLSIRHWMDMQQHYLHRHVLGTTLVDFWTLTNEKAENRREEQMVSAVLDMWLLSFCDRLLITHQSSFGSTAAGLAGIDGFSMAVTVVHNLHIDWRNMSGPTCHPISSEPCDPLGGPVYW
ncbi:unnamed protein product, partial [Closterium sp. Naga37s-1]